MKVIKCQYCKPEDQGCPACGGFKEVLVQVKTPCCLRTYWTRPGVTTMYDGKKWISFDGVALQMKAGKTQCQKCPDLA